MSHEAALKRLRKQPADTFRLIRSDFERSVGTSGQRSKIGSFKAERPVAIRDGRPFDVSVVATETFATNGTAGDQETFDLSNDLIDSNAVADSLVLYDDGAEVEPDAVDFGADSFSYTDGDTGSDLTVYYSAGDQARIDIQKVSPSGVPDTLFSGDVGLIHRRDQSKDPLTFGFNQGLQNVIPTDFTLEIYVDAPYSATIIGQDGDGDGDREPARNALIDINAIGAPGKVDGLAAAVRADSARR